ncbi:hypothetical protein DPEC_G00244760 [Dallia pectoralis]|uniref:Uncharacterized protein n=1 Tax=Dallia pectoralis TaxID=75939 RepID=A0ACC2FVT9_DALPE|nr:hypothetical protein DPEC_G00244760 [Dallia pectoralis]
MPTPDHRTPNAISTEVEMARIDATLNALVKEGEAEAALAAAHVLEAAADEEHHAIDFTEQGISPKTPPSIRRAHNYLNAHFANCSSLVTVTRRPDTGQLVGHDGSHHLRQSQTPIATSSGEWPIDSVGREQPRFPPIHIEADVPPSPDLQCLQRLGCRT